MANQMFELITKQAAKVGKAGLRGSFLTASICLASISLSDKTQAAEGAASNYLPGAYGNFGVAVAPAPGYYFQNDFYYYDGSASVAVLSGKVEATVDAKLYIDYMTGLWVPDMKVFGAQYAAGISVGFGHADLTGSITGPLGGTISRSFSETGILDTAIIPASLYWTLSPEVHINLYEIIIAPTGGYSTSNTLNLGRNYYSFDTVLAMTYLSKTGTEFSITPGIMFNTKNQATDYQTGTEFHMDWMINQFLKPNFAVGVQGYVYRQLTNDSGSGAILGGFKGEGNGIGAAIMYAPVIGGRPIKLVAKVMHEFGVKRRLSGTYGQFQIGFKF